MGISHVLTVAQDALEFPGSDRRTDIENEVGKQVYKLCLQREIARTPGGPNWITCAAVGNHGNAIQWVDDVHSSENLLFLWGGNCLRPLRCLSGEELRFTLACVEEELKKRADDSK